jgi:hypothetical protein
MAEIKRYGVNFVKQDDDCHAIVVMSEQLKGEWVRWEDVQGLIQAKPRAMASEDILKGMDAAIRGESNRPGVINGPGFVDQNELSLKERAK